MAFRSHVIFFFPLLLAILLPCGTVLGWYQREYVIEVHLDGSATWVIEHSFRLETEHDEMMFEQYSSDTYFTHYFVKNVKALVNVTRQKTDRNMTVENFKITVSYFDSYRTVKYQFDWMGFANQSDAQIMIGDVFEVDGGFFLGDGTLDITYLPRYVVESVSPKPDVDSDQTLKWDTVTNFETGEPRIILREKTHDFMDILKENLTLVISLIALVGISVASLWFLKIKRKKKREAIGAVPHVPTVTFEIEEDEEKVVILLKSAGGRLYQSTIADQLKFSRSKTSMLLTAMENRGKIKREKRGREKMVTLINEAKG